ncbi:MAG: hypothetical protein NT013_05550 [Planctomycetia bacterium]|nr:hypothetical protein [Planctomycetia bacterium]
MKESPKASRIRLPRYHGIQRIANGTRSRREWATLFPFAGELQGALADGFADGLVRRDGGEPFGLRLALVTQEVNQTQSFTLRTQVAAT